MRSAVARALVERAASDSTTFLLTGDLGWGVLEGFAERFPDRFVNVGVAEQNMVGIATGLALVGFVPFVYSIATFASMRAYEQIRNGPVLHRVPVRILGVGGGYAYGHAGPTHHALEDLAIARAQPGLTVVAPADCPQASSVLRAIESVEGPVYLRIGKGGNPDLPGLDGRFTFGVPEVVKTGADVLLLATGTIAHEALDAARRLEREGVHAEVAVLAHLGACAEPPLLDLLSRHRAVVTVEEAYVSGGLGSLVSEAVASAGLSCVVARRGVTEGLASRSGSAAYLRARAGLDAEALAASVLETLRRAS